MGLDTKYRPTTFDGVLGQGATKDILRKLLTTGEAFQQSYLFGGPSGTGKTTTARILARAMLCDDVGDDGEPCNACSSCREILESGESATFQEMDAANNSGKADVERILEEMDYYTMGGKSHRIYLLDEAHSLSTQAMDALLKPLEDEIPGTSDKRMVCLFCTTEPENVRKTIRSRSMVFEIRQPPPDAVFGRLSEICEKEGLDYDADALQLIMDHARGHLRDMLVSLDRVARTGPVTVQSVKKNLGLSTTDLYYEVLLDLPDDLESAMRKTWKALDYTDPQSVASGVGQAALNTFKIQKGLDPKMPGIMRNLAEEAATRFGKNALLVARRCLMGEKVRDANALMCRLLMLREEMEGGFVPPDGPVISEQATVRNEEPSRTVQTENQDEAPEDGDKMEAFRKEAGSMGRFGDRGVKEGGPETDRVSEAPEEENDEGDGNLRLPDETDYEAVLNRFNRD